MDSLNKDIEKMTDSYIQKNGWNEWAKYVLKSLEDLKNQYAENEKKIDVNRESFVEAVNTLQISVIKEMGVLSAEVKSIKKDLALRSVALSSIIPLLAAIVYALIKLV